MAAAGMRVSRLITAPVKSLGVLTPEHVDLAEGRVLGDREFFLMDDDGQLVTCTKNGDLLQYRAEYDSGTSVLAVHGPDGLVRSASTANGESVAQDFYGLRTVTGHVVDGWSDLFSDIVGRPVHLVRSASGGFDVVGVTLLGISSVEALRPDDEAPAIDPRRFRMNVEIRGSSAFEEDSWEGREVRLGSAVVRVGGPVMRCAATTRHPDSGVSDLGTLKLIGTRRGRQETELFGVGFYLGVYAEVITPGRVHVGDDVTVDD